MKGDKLVRSATDMTTPPGAHASPPGVPHEPRRPRLVDAHDNPPGVPHEPPRPATIRLVDPHEPIRLIDVRRELA